MDNNVYTLDEIKKIAVPIARNYDIKALYLFGSYARGEATSESDIDFRVERGNMTDLLALGDLFCDLEDGFGKKLDVLTTQMLSPDFLHSIQSEEILIYGNN
ncbi:MAG: nucleotidyltransferase domain-containing protein [Clostridia bacterium]|nr:nucleotidyltransferase domain-containing protein [Clostridia bacterium]